jgi:hypothetical protein
MNYPTPRPVWDRLPIEDQECFLQLRRMFQEAPKVTSKDRRLDTFPRDLKLAICYIERSPTNTDARAILVGLCFIGPCVCVNTRQLKTFMARSKSSINGSFQQLGYVLIATKAKARECVLASLPTLRSHREVIRQWTARIVSQTARHCFLSSFPAAQLPEITTEDLHTQQKPRNAKPKPITDTEFVPEFRDQFEMPFEPMPLFEGNWQLADERDQFLQSPVSVFSDLSFE